MSNSYNLRERINLIGYCTNQIDATNNLPSIKQVLAVLFYNLRRVSKTLRESSKLAIEECLIIWKKARIPTQEEKKCVTKLEAEYDKWRKIQKNASRRTDTQIKNEEAYQESVNKLFDIAHADALEMIEQECDKLLRNQDPMSSKSNTETNKPSEMEVESTSWNAENNEILMNVDNNDIAYRTISQNNPLLQRVSKEVLNEIIGPESESPLSQSTPPLKRRATELVITPKLAVALDKCKISKRDAMHLLMAAAEAFGIDTHNVVLNATSIHAARQTLRKERYDAIKQLTPALFSDLPSTIHWDGKLLTGYLRRETVDRLAVVITCGKMEQLLGVPQISSSSGANQAEAVFNTLIDWSLLDNIEALGCDSTASNTGRTNGACVILERLIGKDLLYLICRHHMFELVIKGVFEVKFGKSSGPDVPLFKNFGDQWKSIDQTKYESGISDSFVNKSLRDVKEQLLKFCLEYLKKDLIRDDYKEFLELVIIMLGEKLPSGTITFHRPGAIHHARWMAKSIYSLKMFIFRKQYFSDMEMERKCRDVCIFIIRIYAKAWFCAPISAEAPAHDLNFLKSLCKYKRIDESISACAIKKFINHLWYLTPQLAALAFFDYNVSIQEKLQMCKALKSTSTAFVYGKRILVNEKDVTKIIKSSISDFICEESYEFFKRFKINATFLTKDPSQWIEDADYIHGLQIINNLKVVNDTAERGVKLMSEFNQLLTRDNNQFQYLLPVINDYKSLFPDSKKETLMRPYE